MLPKLAARDAAIVAGAALLWLVAAGRSAGADALADFTGVVAGLALGACTFIVHEWGHWLGARISGSTVRMARSLRTLFIFSFDSRANTRGQFLVMSAAGFAGTGLAVWIAYGLLPGELLATRVVRGVTLLSVALTVVTEVPLVVYSLFGRRLPPVEVPVSRRSRREAVAQGES